jgi:predicted DNA-binding transcriptional regulator YafY
MKRAADVRHILLTLIPRHPDRVATTDLVRMLASQGIERTARSVQKTCAELAYDEPDLVCDDRSKPFQWQWRKDAKIREFPPMNAHGALTLRIAFEQAKHLLPASTLEHLKHQQRRAEEVLNASATMRSWRKKIRVLPRGLAQLPPAIDREVLRVVYETLLSDQKLGVSYRGWNKTEDEQLEVTPLVLVSREVLLTLVCTIAGRDGVRQLHLHRMRSAKNLGGKRTVPADFDIDEHIRGGGLAFRKGEAPITLRLRLHPDVTPTLGEFRLAADQTLTATTNGDALLEATVPNTLELRGWLKSYGPKVEVLGPPELRREIAEELRAAAKLYAKE